MLGLSTFVRGLDRTSVHRANGSRPDAGVLGEGSIVGALRRTVFDSSARPQGDSDTEPDLVADVARSYCRQRGRDRSITTAHAIPCSTLSAVPVDEPATATSETLGGGESPRPEGDP